MDPSSTASNSGTERGQLRRFLVPALSCSPLWWLLRLRLSTAIRAEHDFDIHLVSWFDCLNSWRHGIVYPQWTPSANYGAGEPRFIFYPPLTWMLGAALGLVLPWQAVPIVLTFLLLAATGLATRRWLCTNSPMRLQRWLDVRRCFRDTRCSLPMSGLPSGDGGVLDSAALVARAAEGNSAGTVWRRRSTGLPRCWLL